MNDESDLPSVVWGTTLHAVRSPTSDDAQLLALWTSPGAGNPEDVIKLHGHIISLPGQPEVIKEFGAKAWTTSELSLSTGCLRIAPEWRGRGIGTIALNRLVAWARYYHRHAQVRRYHIPTGDEVESDPLELKKLYERYGFRWASERPDPDGSPWLSNSPMVHELKTCDRSEVAATGELLLKILDSREKESLKIKGDAARYRAQLGRLAELGPLHRLFTSIPKPR